jgi:hypothetical protein
MLNLIPKVVQFAPEEWFTLLRNKWFTLDRNNQE